MVSNKSFSYFSPWLLFFTTAWLLCYYCGFSDHLELASKNWPLIFVGLAGAIIGNVTAIGGGLVFIPVLLFAYRIDPLSALKLSFVTQAVGMSSGASGWLRRGDVPLPLLKWTVPALVIGTLVSTFLIHPHPLIIKGLFGPIAFFTGFLILMTMDSAGSAIQLPEKARKPLLIVSFIGGMITGWVAIGEGEIVAAFCMLAYGLKAELAIGLGVVLLSINSLLLAIIHICFFGGIPWELAAFTILGVLWGGRLGSFLTQYLPHRTTKRIFAVIALLDGLAVTLQAGYALFLAAH